MKEKIQKRRLTCFGHVTRASADRLPSRAMRCYTEGRKIMKDNQRDGLME